VSFSFSSFDFFSFSYYRRGAGARSPRRVGCTKACVVLKIGLQYTIAADLRTRPLGVLGFKVDIAARQNAAQKPGGISFNLFFGFGII